ncbi:alkylation response protein AidB-like acyl-CoA dehydrogenase [Blastomonas natatoria]|uniref:Alkylation response protein AidB-like acyl-CoA dehydrogenase n=1 Tax=Blastomonas natatoria TaxID=34015 RepID=A0A2V3VMX7_9SPHN|nr:acyl-CoA dehydrogenase family protein [Blastomonas natatoria]PXW77949.1 alkylation response protein AidB-like acyl-CoA dehydrogenase [Blastomonas natatoria]
MNFDYDESQLLYRASVERFLEGRDIAARKAQRAAPGGIDRARWQALAELGLTAMALGQDKGGLGSSLLDLVAVGESFGLRISSDNWLENAVLPMLLAGSGLVEHHPLIHALASGEAIAALALFEPGGRHVTTPRVTTAKQTANGFVLQGEKSFSLGGMAADWLLVSAATDSGPALFLVAANASGLHRRGYRVIDGNMAAEIRLLGCEVATDARLALDWDVVEAALGTARLVAAAEMAGLARRLFDDTLAYVRQREQFGQPIGRFQAIQHRMVDAYALVDQAKSALIAAVTSGEANEIAGMKAVVAEAALAIGREAVQLHGGMGTTDELEIGHAHKRVLLLSQWLGDPASGLDAYAQAAIRAAA